uniref:Uncharacterized protein n=1 Tax=Oryza rufipogon TaxID=4529 RepID=A0A0E0NJP4_ORYRU
MDSPPRSRNVRRPRPLDSIPAHVLRHAVLLLLPGFGERGGKKNIPATASAAANQRRRRRGPASRRWRRRRRRRGKGGEEAAAAALLGILAEKLLEAAGGLSEREGQGDLASAEERASRCRRPPGFEWRVDLEREGSF